MCWLDVFCVSCCDCVLRCCVVWVGIMCVCMFLSCLVIWMLLLIVLCDRLVWLEVC